MNHNFKKVNNNKIQKLKAIEEKLSFATNILIANNNFFFKTFF
jgi:hypothetical protein